MSSDREKGTDRQGEAQGNIKGTEARREELCAENGEQIGQAEMGANTR